QRATFNAAPARDASAPAIDSMEGLALELFGRYSLPFQATSLLLLVTMVGVIVLAKRQRGGDEPAKGDKRP
ncbi:MAG: NADH-quinone oxidoreductase subunit J, partial [Planctomycetaceae bacterium]|nr:NADH-quinone oxidoreductase subunit J [Planctomycetaceae bacterium]